MKKFKDYLKYNILNETLITHIGDQLIPGEKYQISSGMGGSFTIIYKGLVSDINSENYGKHEFDFPKTSHGFGDKKLYYYDNEVKSQVHHNLSSIYNEHVHIANWPTDVMFTRDIKDITGKHIPMDTILNITKRDSVKVHLNNEFILSIDNFVNSMNNGDIETVENESNDLQPVQAGEIVKLQKPQESSFIDIITNNDGIDMGKCTICGADNVIITDHICKTIIENPNESIQIDENVTDVLFLYEKDDTDVFAYFPNEKADDINYTCYSHIGQHSACSKEYANECRQALINDYMSLKQELESIGYNLNVLNSIQEKNNHYDSIRFKYGINENKMITKIEWFKDQILKK